MLYCGMCNSISVSIVNVHASSEGVVIDLVLVGTDEKGKKHPLAANRLAFSDEWGIDMAERLVNMVLPNVEEHYRPFFQGFRAEGEEEGEDWKSIHEQLGEMGLS